MARCFQVNLIRELIRYLKMEAISEVLLEHNLRASSASQFSELTMLEWRSKPSENIWHINSTERTDNKISKFIGEFSIDFFGQCF